MAKRNKILISVLVAAVLALLIALCFVGNTFARYTLKQSETVSASIAEWEVTVTEGDGTSTSEEESVSVGTLKPFAAEYSVTEESPRTTEEGTNFVCVAKLTNTGDVSATVSVTADTTKDETDQKDYLDMSAEYDTFASIGAMNARGGAYNIVTTGTKDDDGVYGNVKEITEDGTTSYQYVPGDDYGYAGTETTGTAFAAEIAKHFTASLRWSYSTVDENGDAIAYATANKFSYDADEEETDVTDPTVDPEGTDGGNEAVYIWLDVEWLTDLSDGNNGYTNGDGFDTWAGTWVSAFTFGLTVEAYQAS